MILKIERYQAGGNNQDWWLLDDIRKISKEEFVQHPDEDFSAEEADIFILDYIDWLKTINANVYLDDIREGRMERKVGSLVCRLSNGHEFKIIFDTIAYICNDEGKTIEKVVMNYR